MTNNIPEGYTVPILLMYMGSFEGNKKGEMFASFRMVTEEMLEEGRLGPAASKLCYYDLKKVRKNLGTIQPGKVMTFYSKDPEGANITFGGATFKATWPVREDVVRWQAEELTRERSRIAQKLLKEAATESDLFTALNPVREAYGAAVGANRTQLLAAVVAYITRT